MTNIQKIGKPPKTSLYLSCINEVRSILSVKHEKNLCKKVFCTVNTVKMQCIK